MHTHLRPPKLGRALIAFAAVGLALAPSAGAATNDLNDFNMGPGWGAYPASYAATVNSVQYRWLDVPPVTTEIGTYNCANGVWYGSSTFPSGSGGTSYRQVGWMGTGSCFTVTGHTSSGYMFYYDGRVSR